MREELARQPTWRILLVAGVLIVALSGALVEYGWPALLFFPLAAGTWVIVLGWEGAFRQFTWFAAICLVGFLVLLIV